MTENPKVYYKRHSKSGGDVDDKFDVDVSKATKTMLFILLVIFIALLYIYPLLDGNGDTEQGIYWTNWYDPIILIAATIPAIILWLKIGPYIGQKVILAWLRRVSSKKRPTPGEILVGFPRVKDPYFIEANPVDFELSKAKMFLLRVKEVIFLSIGLSVIIAQVLIAQDSYFFKLNLDAFPDYINPSEMIIYTVVYIGPLSLVVLGFIMPLMWISDDMQIYRIDEYQDTQKVGFYVRNGALSKILGFFGIMLAFTVAKEFAQTAFPVDADTSSITQWIYVFIYFGFMLIGTAVYPLMVTLFYMMMSHKEWVNTTRIKASEFIPCATMQINHVDQKELEYLTHPEKLKEFDKPDFSDKSWGKLVIIILIVITVIICLYMGLIIGTELDPWRVFTNPDRWAV